MRKYFLHIFILFLFDVLSLSAKPVRVVTIGRYSDVLDKMMETAVIAPADLTSEDSYPVLFLLHGLGGNYRNWLEVTDILSYAENYNFVIVLPDAGKSWYLDSPVVAESHYESYVINELVPQIDAWHGMTKSSYRGICGTSMGGHGAVLLALRHPDVFDAASSLSGALDITAHPEWGGVWSLDSLLNPYDMNPEHWHHNCCYDLIENFQPQFKLFFDCGDADPFVLHDNRRFAARCDSLGIAHLYDEYPGEHKWTFWDQRIQKHLDFHQQNAETTGVKHGLYDTDTASAWPNPFNSHVTISISEPLSNSSVSIYNIYGQKIKSLPAIRSHQQDISWNGRNDFGYSVPSGIYVVTFETSTGAKSIKLNYVK
jgi:S-formylglutathione hydrolase FrmB